MLKCFQVKTTDNKNRASQNNTNMLCCLSKKSQPTATESLKLQSRDVDMKSNIAPNRNIKKSQTVIPLKQLLQGNNNQLKTVVKESPLLEEEPNKPIQISASHSTDNSDLDRTPRDKREIIASQHSQKAEESVGKSVLSDLRDDVMGTNQNSSILSYLSEKRLALRNYGVDDTTLRNAMLALTAVASAAVIFAISAYNKEL
jgi:hypothetical protein